MRDPLEELRNLDAAGPALPAHEVRRRGDRMRRRRTALQAVGAAAAVAVIASGGALMTGSLSSTAPPAGPATPAPVETPSPAPQHTEPPDPPTPAPEPEPEPTPGPTPEDGWRITIPDGFPISRGLPEAGDDTPAWEWSEGPGTQLSAVACGEREKPPARPVDGLRVAVEPPDGSAWRHLLLFEDAVTAAEAHGNLLASAGRCPEGSPGVPEDRTSPDEMRWFLSQSARGRTPVIDIEGRVYARDSDVRVPGRVLTRVVQVGNALLVARLDSASSGIGRDAEAREFTSEVEILIEEMCAFAANGCGG